MALYDKYFLPRLLDLAMRNKEATRYRAEIVPRAKGVVLEIGVGSGLNLPFYGPAVDHVYAVDPSDDLLRMARKRSCSAAFQVDFLRYEAEALPLKDNYADTVVTTFTLCTIPDAAQALSEVKRVLKPDGMLLFAEHGLAPDASVQRWQHRLNPLWKKLAGGCNLDRPIAHLISSAGFHVVELKREYAKGPRPMSYIYTGAARAR